MDGCFTTISFQQCGCDAVDERLHTRLRDPMQNGAIKRATDLSQRRSIGAPQGKLGQFRPEGGDNEIGFHPWEKVWSPRRLPGKRHRRLVVSPKGHACFDPDLLCEEGRLPADPDPRADLFAIPIRLLSELVESLDHCKSRGFDP